ncbi:uncharacterized protein NESG_00625 [Nematocida ausubeli]|uniref:Uncharacterized protein n=1 Tax=Nematocida ausubeli (strain ATCC PRA-371 / ERTm2) TaxID=1913371 RepID=A0A086J2W1_NEMA1|nr:uncharacterized protein NESG_00625 [Nematocida ausubeli]KFG26479.1 hypothetical protein NESG_00625 [Nematocida ausubeli]
MYYTPKSFYPKTSISPFTICYYMTIQNVSRVIFGPCVFCNPPICMLKYKESGLGSLSFILIKLKILANSKKLNGSKSSQASNRKK